MVSWEQLSQLFDEARNLSPSQRAGYLDRICVDNASLRAELERLLDAHDRAGPFMNNPVIRWSVSTLSTSPAVFCAGEKVAGRFRIICFLGVGGMGQVYKAEDEVLSGFVALKTIRPEIALDQRIFERFKQEVSLAKKVTHDNVCRVFDLDHNNVPPYITMELVEGETLSARLRRTGKMTPSEALPLIVQMTDGLQAAHRKSVIHGDFKPGNVMLVRTSEVGTLVKITDFGLARTADQEGPSLTRPAGTVAYMAPDQLAGGKATVASDIYALGLVMYEMVTGVKPEFNRMTEPAPSPQLLVPGLDPKWTEAILRCLARDPASRFSSAIDVVGSIRGENLPPGWIARLLSRVRNPVRQIYLSRLVITCTALIVLAAATYYGRWIYDRYWHEVPFRQIQLTRLTTSGKAARAAISPDGKYLAYIHFESGEQSLWVSQVSTPGGVMLIPPSGAREGYGELAFSPDSALVYYVKYDDQGPPTLYSVPALGGASRRVLADVDGLSPVSVSPDGRRVAFIRTSGTAESALMLAEVDSGELRNFTSRKSPDVLIAIAWSPDGKTIACDVLAHHASERFAKIFAVPVEGGTEKLMTNAKLHRVDGLTWLLDGKTLILNGVDRPGAPQQLWMLSWPGGVLRRITNNLESYHGLSVSRDGSIVTVQQRISSSIWITPEAKAERSRHFAMMADQDSFGLSWAPDGRIVHSRYGIAGNTEIWITNQDGGGGRQLVAGPGRNISPRVSGDGRYVVFASDRSGTYHLWRISLDGGNLKQLTHGGGELQFDISPDGGWIYFSSDEYQKYKLYKTSIQGGSPLLLSDKPAAWPSVSADGTLIALDVTIGHPTRRTIAVLPAEGGPDIKRLEIDSWTPIPFRWSRDGKALLYVKDGDGPSNNVWRHPLDGGKPTRVTNFTGDEEVFWFDLASDGKHLACIRGVTTYDAVMIRGVR